MDLHPLRTLLLTLCSSFAFSACAPSAPPPTAALQASNPVPAERLKNTQPKNAEPIRISTVPLATPPNTVAKSVFVVDSQTGRALYAKNADERRAVASTQKLLTALTVMDHGPLNDPVTVQSTDTNVEPTKVYIKPGELYTRSDLMKALIVKSGNDVARALARDVAGGQQAFMQLMNKKASQLGMQNSFFMNAHGLTEEGQYSTARDLSRMAIAAWKNKNIRSWTNTKSYTFKRPNGQTKTLQNTNKLLKRVAYCDGMKTGTTRASGKCLISSGTFNGRSAIVIVLGSTSAEIWNDSEKLLRWALERPAAEN